MTEADYLDNFGIPKLSCTRLIPIFKPSIGIIRRNDDKTTFSVIKTIPQELVDCDCCDRHRQTFPSSLSVWVDIQLTGPCYTSGNTMEDKDQQREECSCPCRHVARYICREIESDNESLGSVDSVRSKISDTESNFSFIEPDDGMTQEERQKLNKVIPRLHRPFKFRDCTICGEPAKWTEDVFAARCDNHREQIYSALGHVQ